MADEKKSSKWIHHVIMSTYLDTYLPPYYMECVWELRLVYSCLAR